MIFEADLAACETLIEVSESLRARGIRLAIAHLHDRVKAALARDGVIARLGEDAFFLSALRRRHVVCLEDLAKARGCW